MSLAFGGPAWPVNPVDLNFGPLGNGQCLGGVFDFLAVINMQPAPGTPDWVVGDAFLVRFFAPFVLKTGFA